MSTTTTPTNPTEIPPDSARFDGMELNDAEAELHALPLQDFDPAATPAPAVVETPAPDPDPTPAPPVVEPAPTPEPAPAPAPAPVAQAPAPLFAEAPVATRDFAKDAADLRAKFDAGEVTTEEFVEQSHAITIEQAKFEAQNAIYQAEQKRVADTQAAAKAAADEAWNTAALQFETAHADFLKNPLHRNDVETAIRLIDKQTGGTLSPEKLLEEAFKAAYQGRQMEYPKPGATALRDAVASRAPDPRGLPTNLGSAPSAGGEDLRGNETFAALDRLDADQLEDALARLPYAQREAYLADAPGARTSGRD